MKTILYLLIAASAAFAGPIAGGQCSDGTAGEWAALGSTGCTTGVTSVTSEIRIIRDFFFTLNGATVPDADIRFGALGGSDYTVRAVFIPIADHFSLAMGLNVEGGVLDYSPGFSPSVRLVDFSVAFAGAGCDAFFVGLQCSGTTVNDPNFTGVRFTPAAFQSGYQFSFAATATSPGTAIANIHMTMTPTLEPTTVLLAAPALVLLMALRYLKQGNELFRDTLRPVT